MDFAFNPMELLASPEAASMSAEEREELMMLAQFQMESPDEFAAMMEGSGGADDFESMPLGFGKKSTRPALPPTTKPAQYVAGPTPDCCAVCCRIESARHTLLRCSKCKITCVNPSLMFIPSVLQRIPCVYRFGVNAVNIAPESAR
jgi:hypothetical protein